MERLLVTGLETAVGSNLALALADRFDVLGLCRAAALESRWLQTAAWDPADARQLESLVRQAQPQWIIHCGPLSPGSWDEAPDDAAAAREPAVAAHLAELAGAVSARLTVISSDVVFAGPWMFHEETAAPSSPSPRAAQARAVEKAVESTGALVVRTHAYGWSPLESSPGFAETAFRALAGGGAVAADGLRHATPILATDLAELLARAYQVRLQGLYHLAGAERTSPYRFVCELALAAGLDFERRATERPADRAWHDETSLNSRRARRALEMSTPLLREGLARFVAQVADGWRDRWQVAAGRGAEVLAA